MLLIKQLFHLLQKALPKMSETEKTAIEASTTWWETELFKGNPNWQTLLQYPKATLTPEEQAFFDGPVEELCQMANNWTIAYESRDLPPEIWQFLKDKGFMGLIIPKQYGGLGFSALAHSEIAAKIAGHCTTLSTTVSVPNTLGPAELLIHYGTEPQKQYYLPRLAKGLEIPCFGLTSPEAGSDAGAIPDTGIVTKGNFHGHDTIGIRLNWNKRYITLAPVATVLGLAFKLYDPDHLYFDKPDLGITCALIPVDTPGVTIGRRHLPGGSPFQNGPTQGTDVFIPLDWIIGGPSMAGHGWRMLTECLASGRAITLPASSAGGARVACLSTGAYSRIRNQFRTPISAFEGIQEALGTLAGLTYVAEATRTMTALAVNLGEKPAVPSAIAKYHVTEMGRRICLMAMDVHAGKAVMLGPKNYLAGIYQSLPIGITVEGANILTRNMIIFGQGALRCHPFIRNEMQAIVTEDFAGLKKNVFSHVGHVLYHISASFFQAITLSYFVKAPHTPAHRYFQKMTRAAHVFALLTDCLMTTVGGKLKFKENLSARLGDMLSMLYMGSACLKRFHDDNTPSEDWPLFQWSMEYCLSEFWKSVDGLLDNFPYRFLALLVKLWVKPLGNPVRPPVDALTRQVAELFCNPTPTRARLTAGVFLKECANNPLASLEKAFHKVILAEPFEKAIYKAIHHGLLPDRPLKEILSLALEKKIITDRDVYTLHEGILAREKMVAVDDFDPKTWG